MSTYYHRFVYFCIISFTHGIHGYGATWMISLSSEWSYYFVNTFRRLTFRDEVWKLASKYLHEIESNWVEDESA